MDANDGVSQPFALAGAIEVLRGPAASLPPEDVLSGRHDAGFVAADSGSLRCGDGMVCWVRLALARTPGAPPQWLLRVRAVRPGTALLYAPSTPAGEAAPQAGREYPLNWRYVGTELFFALQLEPERPGVHHYLRLENTPGVDGFAVLQPAGFERQQRQLSLYLNTSMGAAFALLMLNLIFWRWLRDALFLHFALVMFSAVALHAWQTLPSMAVPEVVGSLSLRGALQALFQATTILFVSRLFDFRRHAPRAATVVDVFALLTLLAGVPALVGEHDWLGPWSAVIDLAGLLAGAGMVGWLILVKQQWQFAWPAAMLLLIALSSALGRLRWLGLADIGPDEGLGPSWAAVRLIYMLVLAVTVADRTRRAEIQLRHARRRALDDALKAERELEEKVRLRTLELDRSLSLLADEIELRRQAEGQLQVALAAERGALRQQRQFVSLVSHEFRTPLAVIDATAQSIGLPGVELQPRLAKIRRAVQRLNLLVVNCLAEDRLHADRVVLKAEPIDLRALIEAMPQSLGPADRSRVRLALPRDAVPLRGDRALLEIALHNLVQNALKYSPTARDVGISLVVRDRIAWVDVEDHGEGIPADEQTRIFERFFRGADSHRASGTGLGLFLCSEIARGHGGTVVLLRSDARGSVFRFELPLSHGPAAH
ncbi:ATP-binding protein [Variovorax sp. M-6]|uniref:ATP-binding protein n=1 Tax=Variovorax sp. M-6 TaxID=3233041 RepID=UPI003F9CF838